MTAAGGLPIAAGEGREIDRAARESRVPPHHEARRKSSRSDKPQHQRPARRPSRAQLDPARRAAFDVLRAVSSATPTRIWPCRHSWRSGDQRAGCGFCDRADIRHLPEPQAARCTRHRLGRRPAGGPDRSGPARPAAPRHLPTVAYQRGRARSGIHDGRAGGYQIRYGASRFRQRCVAAVTQRDEQAWISELAPPIDTDPVGASRVHPRTSQVDCSGVHRCAGTMRES